MESSPPLLRQMTRVRPVPGNEPKPLEEYEAYCATISLVVGDPGGREFFVVYYLTVEGKSGIKGPFYDPYSPSVWARMLQESLQTEIVEMARSQLKKDPVNNWDCPCSF